MAPTDYISREEVLRVLKKYHSCSGGVLSDILSIPYIPDKSLQIKELIEKKIAFVPQDEFSSGYKKMGEELPQEIKSRLTEGTEYKIGEIYEFSQNLQEWEQCELLGFEYLTTAGSNTEWNHIRPIQPISPELTQAISVLEANGYTVSKK